MESNYFLCNGIAFGARVTKLTLGHIDSPSVNDVNEVTSIMDIKIFHKNHSFYFIFVGCFRII